MTGETSFAQAITTGEWSAATVDRLRAVAIGSISLDSLTTWHVLASDGYIEYNPILGGLWEIHPLAAMAYFLGLYLVLGVVCTRRLGWVSTALAAYFTVVMGLFGGLNNLALFVFGGPSLVDLLSTLPLGSGSETSLYVVPLLGGVAGIGAARFRHGRLPWREVVGVSVAVVVASQLGNRALVFGIQFLSG